jgi:hypothetical protein
MAIKLPIVSEFDKKGILQAEKTLNQFGKNVGIAFAAVGAAVIGAGLVIADFGAKSIAAAENVRQADDRLKQVATSMGIFGAQTDAVSARLIKFAEANELTVAVDAEVIKATQAKLLTFKELANTADETGGAFDRATTAALDLASAGFGSAEGNATALGKALNDPIKGITALTRSGVTFTKQEKENIKVLVESGKTLQAQEMILKAIETQVGGTAAATAKSSDKMKLAFENIYEQVGEALLPVFDEFVAVIQDLTPQIGNALTPIAQNLADVFKTQVLPAIQNFTTWLASPAGIQKVKDLTAAIFDGIGKFVGFATAVVNNWDAITKIVGAIAILVVSFKTLTAVIEIAKAVQLLWNITLIANPLGLIITALALAAIGIVAFTTSLNGSTEALDANDQATKALEDTQDQLVSKIKKGGYEQNQYQRKLILTNDKLMQLKTGFSSSAGEANKFNNLKFGGVNGEIDATARRLKGLANQFGETTGEARRFANLAPDPAVKEEQGGGGGGGQTAAEKAAEARKKVQDLIKDTRKQVIAAQADYRKAVAKANSDFLANEVKIQRDYADKFADIIAQSKNRIKDAFKSIASFTVATFLSDFRQVEEARLRSFEDAKKVAVDLGKAFTEVFIAGDPVQAYLDSLRAKVTANQKILQVSAKLLEQGFSQTFIEQIIATGADGGLALAEGILSSNPEVISEIKTLFKDIERVSETGANALADQLYEQQGLATRELNLLFEKTQADLLDALAANYTDYTDSLADAATALKESITEISTDFSDAIAEMGTELGGLEKTIKLFRDALNGIYDSTTKATKPLSPKGAGKTSDGVGFEFDINSALGTNLLQNTQQTIINVNVQTDATQSTAMVGKAVGNAITKYVSTGGQVRVISGNVAV